MAAFAELVVDLKPVVTRAVMNVLEIAIQQCPIEMYMSAFLVSGLFYRIVGAIMIENVYHLNSWSYLQGNIIITSQYLNILARIALQNSELELNILRGTLNAGEDVVSGFIERWAGPKVKAFTIYP